MRKNHTIVSYIFYYRGKVSFQIFIINNPLGQPHIQYLSTLMRPPIKTVDPGLPGTSWNCGKIPLLPCSKKPHMEKSKKHVNNTFLKLLLIGHS